MSDKADTEYKISLCLSFFTRRKILIANEITANPIANKVKFFNSSDRGKSILYIPELLPAFKDIVLQNHKHISPTPLLFFQRSCFCNRQEFRL